MLILKLSGIQKIFNFSNIFFVAKRTWLMSFHKKADKHRWDVERYNKLKKVTSNIFLDTPVSL